MVLDGVGVSIPLWVPSRRSWWSEYSLLCFSIKGPTVKFQTQNRWLCRPRLQFHRRQSKRRTQNQPKRRHLLQGLNSRPGVKKTTNQRPRDVRRQIQSADLHRLYVSPDPESSLPPFRIGFAPQIPKR